MADIVIGMIAIAVIWSGSGLFAYGLWYLSANDPGDWRSFYIATALGLIVFLIWWIWSGGSRHE